MARFAQFLSLGRTELVPEDADTYLEGVQQILPGHSCIVRFDGVRTDECYWEPTTSPQIHDDDPSRVAAAYMERSGDISVIPRRRGPVTERG